ncbi:transport and Golgi organization 2 homolog [Chenopodium quinoa]|uniref:Transport and Golgi organization 2 homolog n=1 Tax=Chenopodium quinoa TaxID=63459 RepID=A0A803LGS3_CHEQI|nr:transport and Golgi organization 2 homolog [Chenopodium quinoa]
MCITVFLWQAHPLYPFLLLLNRDEYHSRPTKPAGWWEGEDIIGGKDEVGGGTWLACSKNGRVAFLTNFRETESLPSARTRGDLPVRFLKCKKDPAEFADEIIQESDQYNGFNLILADLHSKTMVYVTNRPKENKPSALQVSPGIHVLTNSSLDSPWPKALRLHHNFKELMDTYDEGEVHVNEMVENLMMDTTKADKSLLPGIYPPHFEYQLSSIFIDFNSPKGRYGTRSISAVLVKDSGEVCFHERYLEDDSWKEHAITYQIE